MLRQTSLLAFHSLTDDQVNKRQREVLEALRKIEPATNRMISESSHIPINVVTPRTGELVRRGLVVKAYVNFDRNGRRAIFWRTKDEG